ncbi:DUF1294 domain-containing protein [Halobacillus locisalis]|uniref:DUF1294 domain-containing protein n=1 Tax=Halobacillus locisalis TaxID=220753 RepID=A0A838CMM8_9BACI|nr:DUF1294 domain-containing protein [Halobacillus locisalis]MBA2173377.1 DUF1294 domain-containing protein [Halobacillus locisalis]
MPILIQILLILFLGMNVLMYILMWIDKRRAETDKWRISEKTLWVVAFLGGSIGGWLAMRLFRHKTKHTSFAIGLPGVSIIYLSLLLYVERMF